jgi:hypothetical protein
VPIFVASRHGPVGRGAGVQRVRGDRSGLWP